MALSKRNQVLLHARQLGYRVDDDGTCRKPDGSRQRVHIDSRGYLSFTARCGETRSPITVHRLAAIQRFGADALFTDGIEVRHLDNDRLNNTLANLALGSKRDNHGDNTGETNKRKCDAALQARRRLSDTEVFEVLQRVHAGELQREVATAFGVNPVIVSQIKTGLRYAHVTGVVYTPGRSNPTTRKLSDEQARTVVTAYHTTGVSQGEMSLQYGIPQGTIGNIIRGRLYADATADLRAHYSVDTNAQRLKAQDAQPQDAQPQADDARSRLHAAG